MPLYNTRFKMLVVGTQVKPTRIPISRWVLAAQWRQDHIPLVNHFGVERVNKALSRLTRSAVLECSRRHVVTACIYLFADGFYS